MPWKEYHVMDERLRFVARLLEGEKMAPLCTEFGISRKTGYLRPLHESWQYGTTAAVQWSIRLNRHVEEDGKRPLRVAGRQTNIAKGRHGSHIAIVR